ncbi:hypothetical protein JXB31_00675, partial [Candidatus Woesearchaeota archaeon]|nr:hypothetical protein [Candidatus Woesearchaeota archaeon]
MPPSFNPLYLGVEMLYTLLIFIFCFLIYYRTREIYNLTKHKGIQYFRYAFMFFGLAYASRLFLFLIIFWTDNMLGPHMGCMALMPTSNLVVAFFSTMAILYLAYSTIWKNVESEHFLTFANIIALFIAVIAFVSRSTLFLSFIQLILIIAAGLFIFRSHKHEKRRYGTKTLYMLIFVSWFFSLIVLQSRHFTPFEIKIVLQVVSIAAFLFIYLKVSKWVK